MECALRCNRRFVGLILRLVVLAVMFAVQPLAIEVRAQQPQFEDRVGDRYEIRLESVSETSGDRSSGSSRDVTTLVERVIALRDDGVELESTSQNKHPQKIAPEPGSFQREFLSRRDTHSNCSMAPNSKRACNPGWSAVGLARQRVAVGSSPGRQLRSSAIPSRC